LYNKYDNLLYSSKINEDLKKESQYPFESSNEPITTGGDANDALQALLNPRDMSGVLRSLEKEGFLLNIRGKKTIRSELGFKRLPGRPDSQNVSASELHRRGGTPSVEKITGIFEKTRRVMAKPEARDLLRKKLLSTKLTYAFDRFILESVFHCAKLDPTVAANLVAIAAPPEKMSQVSEYGPYIKQMASFDEIQVKLYLGRYSGWMTETRPYDIHFLLSILNFM
jgi:hypothetical protein